MFLLIFRVMIRIVSPKQALLLHFWTFLRLGRDLQAWIYHLEWTMTMVKRPHVNLVVCAPCPLLLLHHHLLHLEIAKEMEAWHWATAPALSV